MKVNIGYKTLTAKQKPPQARATKNKLSILFVHPLSLRTNCRIGYIVFSVCLATTEICSKIHIRGRINRRPAVLLLSFSKFKITTCVLQIKITATRSVYDFGKMNVCDIYFSQCFKEFLIFSSCGFCCFFHTSFSFLIERVFVVYIYYYTYFLDNFNTFFDIFLAKCHFLCYTQIEGIEFVHFLQIATLCLQFVFN